MKRPFVIATVVFLAILLPILPRPAEAQEVLVDASTLSVATDVINGTIVRTHDVVVAGEPHRVAEVSVDDTVVGSVTESILVEVPGGTLPNGTTLIASNQPEFIVGHQLQFALVATPEAESQPLAETLQSDMAVYSVVGGLDGTFSLSDDGGQALGPNDYNLMGTQWPSFSSPIPFKVNADGSGLSAAETQAAVQRGFQVWEDDVSSNVDFTYAGASTIGAPDLGDGVNNISWVATPNGADTWLAQAVWFTDSNGGVLGFDIKFNRDYPWANGAQAGRYDIGTVTAHEAGHALGLGHVGASSEVMYYSISPGGIKPLGSGDRNGAAYLYPTPGAGFVPLDPARILDTRDSIHGAYSTPWSQGQTRQVQVGGLGGVPASGIEAVAIHITTVNPTAPESYLTVWRSDEQKPAAVSTTFGKSGSTVELVNELVITTVSPQGRFSVFNGLGKVDVVIDVVGYFATSSAGGYTGLTPSRVLDTRDNTYGAYSTPWGSTTSRSVQVTGLGGVPSSGVDAVAIHVTTVNPTAPMAYLTIWPTGTPQPLAAAANFGTGSATSEIVNSLIFAKVGPGGAVEVFNSSGDVDVVIDVVGYFSASSADRFSAWTPSRFVDSSGGLTFSTPWGPGETRSFGTACRGLLFHATTANVTSSSSFLTISPSGAAPTSPTAMHNFGTGPAMAAVTSSLVVGTADGQGQIDVRNDAGNVDLFFDAMGGFGCP